MLIFNAGKFNEINGTVLKTMLNNVKQKRVEQAQLFKNDLYYFTKILNIKQRLSLQL